MSILTPIVPQPTTFRGNASESPQQYAYVYVNAVSTNDGIVAAQCLLHAVNLAIPSGCTVQLFDSPTHPPGRMFWQSVGISGSFVFDIQLQSFSLVMAGVAGDCAITLGLI